MPRIEACKNILIYKDLLTADPSPFYYQLNGIGFQPDEIIVRNITATGGDTGDDYNVYYIYCDLLDNDQILGTFLGGGVSTSPQNYCSSPQSVFKVNRPISATSTICIRIEPNDTSTTVGVDRKLSISLDFIKYKEKTKKK